MIEGRLLIYGHISETTFLIYTKAEPSCFTGKLQEFAIKQNAFAFSCIDSIFSSIQVSFTFTCGCNITSENLPLPSSASVILPTAASEYSKTMTEASEHKCRNQSIWQDESEETNISSGLYFILSPRNEGSELASIICFPSTEIWWDLSYPRYVSVPLPVLPVHCRLIW